MKFEPVAPEDIPNFRESHRGRVSYPIVKSFLETNIVVAKLDRTGMQNSMQSLSSCLTSYIRNHDLPIKLFTRQGQLYLMRTDLNEDGSPKIEEEVEDTRPVTPINDEEVEQRFQEELGKVTK